MRSHRYDITIYRPNGKKQAIHTAYGHRAVEQFRQIAKDVYPTGTRLEIVDLSCTPPDGPEPFLEIEGLVSLLLDGTISVQLDTQQGTLLLAGDADQHLLSPEATAALCALLCRYAPVLCQNTPQKGPHYD